MKKNYLFLLLSILCFQAKAQILNESAAWPNGAWTISGDYNTDPSAFESDPTATPNFAFDDDDAGNPHEDNIAAESPVIDLTAAHTGGEDSIEVTVMYGYRYLADDRLIFQYWDADGGVWVDWGTTVPNNSTTATDNFCAIPKQMYSTGVLNISTFTANQLSNFRYRISYDDNVNGTDWNYGFCFDSPTIQSLTCGAPTGLATANVMAESADINWTDIVGITGFEYVLDSTDGDPAGAGTPITGATYSASGLTAETQYYFHLRAICPNGNSPWRQISFTTTPLPPTNDTCQTAIDLASLTSPITESTTLAFNDHLTQCPNGGGAENPNTAPDVYYSIMVPAGSTLTIGQTNNTYDSTVKVFYGDCDNPVIISCFDDDDYTQVIWGNDTGSDQTVYWIQDGYNAGAGEYTLAWSVVACTNSTATFDVVSDCGNGEQFLLTADVTDFGSATSVTVTDDQGSAPQVLNAPGMVQFGPYPNSTPVVISITNDQDSDCVRTSSVLTQAACPPDNDEAAGAVLLTLDEGTGCGPNKITGISNAATTWSVGEVDPTCAFNPNATNPVNGDIWYYFVAPATDLTLNISDIGGNIFSVSNALYSGTPGNFSEIGDCNNTGTKTYTGLNIGETYYWRLWDFGNDGIGTFSICGYYLNCSMHAATYSVTSDCPTTETFTASVEITDMGSAASLTISDDQSSPTQQVTGPGTYTFGPYPNGTSVIFTTVNDDSPACTITSGAQTVFACPGLNDECSAAIELFPSGSFDGSAIDTNNIGATNDANDPLPTCDAFNFATNGKDVWYSVVVPSTGSLTFETDSAGDTNITDAGLEVFSGSCGSLTQLGCNADDGNLNFSRLDLTGLNVGESLLIRVWGYNGASGAFRVSAYDVALGVPANGNDGFKVYPNPVHNVLNLNYTTNITDVAVYNLVGQQVIAKSLNTASAQIDMSHLAVGTYIVKVTADNQVKTIKVVKQ